MKKINILWILLGSLFLVIFNVIFFLCSGTEHPISVWISYGSIHLAYLMLILTPSLSKKGENPAVFGYPLFSISVIYFVTVLVIGVLFILIAPYDFRLTLIVQLIIAGIYAALLLGVLITNENTANHEEQRKENIRFIRELAAELQAMINETQNPDLKKKIETAYESVKYSSIKSDQSVAGLERELSDTIFLLERNIKEGNSEKASENAAKIITLTEERNRKLRLTN